MSDAVAVLGAGAVGGMAAVRLAATGRRVICVVRSDAARAIRADGLELSTPRGTVQARPEAVDHLREAVSLLIVAVKAPGLADAVERVEAFAAADAVVLPLLNGLEHPAVLRGRFGPRVAPGSISRFEGFRSSSRRITQTTETPVVTAASDDVSRTELDGALAPLVESGLEVVVADDERAVLWEKAARLAVLAAATAAAGRSVGELRADPTWQTRLQEALGEACEVAAADGVALSSAAQWAKIDAMPPTLTTSTARDVAAGRPSELDAITGSVLRAAERLAVPAPALSSLFEEAEAACRAR